MVCVGLVLVHSRHSTAAIVISEHTHTETNVLPHEQCAAALALQVGQCGNQVGQALFERLAAQAATVPSSWTATGDLAFADGEVFRVGLDGRRRARAVLVDTEPKVSCGSGKLGYLALQAAGPKSHTKVVPGVSDLVRRLTNRGV